jgi:N4-gp56 family major capsid protein
MNTTSTISYPLNNYYDRNLLERALPLIVHDKWAQIRDLPQGNTDVIKFRKYGALAVNTTALTEGVTPAGKTLSATDVTATVKQYGDYITITDWVSLTEPDSILTEAGEILGEQAGQSLDTILATILNAGTNVQYADVTSPKANAARDEVTSSDVPATDEFLIAVRTMKGNNARKITKLVSADTGYATTPVNACYVGLVHPNTTFRLKSMIGWNPVEKYASKADLMPGEVGSYDEIRFVETTQAKVFSGEGFGSIDVYSTLIIAANAYGITRLAGKALENIIKPLGSGGTTDPLNQRATSGWKATFVAAILHQLYLLRIEHAV